jgi:hypothetical protein
VEERSHSQVQNPLADSAAADSEAADFTCPRRLTLPAVKSTRYRNGKGAFFRAASNFSHTWKMVSEDEMATDKWEVAVFGSK